jgi:hypothetical protein
MGWSGRSGELGWFSGEVARPLALIVGRIDAPGLLEDARAAGAPQIRIRRYS